MSLYDKVIAVFGMLRDSIARRADKSDIAPDFSPSSSYSEGDLVFKDGSLYRCTTAHSGEWSAGSFTETTVDDAIAYRKSRVPGGDSPGSGGSGGSGSGGSGGSGSGSGSGGGDSPGEDDDVSKCHVTGGALTFKNMSGDVTIPQMIKVDYSKAKDLSYHFAGRNVNGEDIVCEGINSLSLGDGFGKSATDVSYCFSGCKLISSVSFRSDDNPNPSDSLVLPADFGRAATSAYGLFSGCTGLDSVSLPDWWTYASGMFEGCTGLYKVTYNGSGNEEGASFVMSSNFGKNGAPSCFKDCTGLVEIDVPSWFKCGEYTFAGCTGLTELSVKSTYQSAEGMFSGCSSLASIDLTGLNSSQYAYSVKNMFSGCRSLKSITIPSGFYDQPSTGGGFDGVFSGCSSLEEIVLNGDFGRYAYPSDGPGRLKKIADVFKGCTSLKKISGTGYIKFNHSFSVADCPLEKKSIDRLIEGLGDVSKAGYDIYLELGSANFTTAELGGDEVDEVMQKGWKIVRVFPEK